MSTKQGSKIIILFAISTLFFSCSNYPDKQLAIDFIDAFNTNNHKRIREITEDKNQVAVIHLLEVLDLPEISLIDSATILENRVILYDENKSPISLDYKLLENEKDWRLSINANSFLSYLSKYSNPRVNFELSMYFMAQNDTVSGLQFYENAKQRSYPLGNLYSDLKETAFALELGLWRGDYKSYHQIQSMSRFYPSFQQYDKSYVINERLRHGDCIGCLSNYGEMDFCIERCEDWLDSGDPIAYYELSNYYSRQLREEKAEEWKTKGDSITKQIFGKLQKELPKFHLIE